jgi:hypothetical protein
VARIGSVVATSDNHGTRRFPNIAAMRLGVCHDES